MRRQDNDAIGIVARVLSGARRSAVGFLERVTLVVRGGFRHQYNVLPALAIIAAAWIVLAVFFSYTPAVAEPSPNGGTGDTPCQLGSTNAQQKCNICMSVTAAFGSANLGLDMIQQMFDIINKIINKIESTFYSGIIGSTAFQQIMGAAFIIYIVIYGIMITFNLASYRSGEVAGRLIKLGIVYAITGPAGWSFFAAWIQHPVLKGINDIIVDIANAGSGSGGKCVGSGGQFSGSGTPITLSGGTQVNLASGPLAMLFGPMTCAFASQFVAGIQSLITTGFYGWILALLLLWGLVNFTYMLVGAIFTYVKAVVGLVFLFGVAPIFFTFYLFEKTRSLTMGWVSMVLGFALQPVMLFTFLAFYAAILGSALGNMFANGSGSSEDICYVPWYTMPGLFNIYWWRFTNAAGVAGGQWIYSSGGAASGSGLSYGDPLPPPIQVINILYFLVLSNLGKNFTTEIENLATLISGGRGGGIVTGDQVGSWFKNNITGGQGPTSLAASGVRGAGRGLSRLFSGTTTKSRPKMGGNTGQQVGN